MLLASSAMAYSGSYNPGEGINGTVHDLGTAHDGMNYIAVPDDSLNRICIFCHAPHNTYRLFGTTGGAGPEAPDGYDYLPLWNHELPLTMPSYVMYTNGAGPLTGSKHSQAMDLTSALGSTSVLCLSCHDGSIAVNSYGNSSQRANDTIGPITSTTQSAGSTLISTSYVIGQDNYLGNHHPIGFSYEDAQGADTELRTSDTMMTGGANPTSISEHLYADKMECATCHSVHNTGNSGEALLWRSDQNSELCLTCHAKGTYTAP